MTAKKDYVTREELIELERNQEHDSWFHLGVIIVLIIFLGVVISDQDNKIRADLQNQSIDSLLAKEGLERYCLKPDFQKMWVEDWINFGCKVTNKGKEFTCWHGVENNKKYDRLIEKWRDIDITCQEWGIRTIKGGGG